MSGELYAQYHVLEQASEAHLDAAEYATRIEQDRQEARLDPGSLGRILPSQDIVSGFEQATEQTREALADLVEACEGLSQLLGVLERHFREVDQAVADQFDQLRGV
ncbi:hypothetical protein NOK12_20510 [Nocardioides sp. OK12]|uniref:hypothetical protein n=1 Tax=Nocardioides sp. OK12 TaxID=2758661 RepID=UPI0021C3F230|nr:hypothetical protein [Nocardioides sp. OK12]GHJ59533.1 hypothetical protein NOK12_20510 [Nocardioides sp. OK12]